MSRRWPGARRARGQALVEFALLVPFLLILMFATFEGARWAFDYITVTNAAREGARLAVVNQGMDCAEAATDGGPVCLAKKRAIDQAVSLGLKPEDVTISYPDCTELGIGCEVRVEVTYRFEPSVRIHFRVPWVLDFEMPTVDLVSTTTMPLEYECPNPYITAADQCPRQP